jgi:hypothetical protein
MKYKVYSSHLPLSSTQPTTNKKAYQKPPSIHAPLNPSDIILKKKDPQHAPNLHHQTGESAEAVHRRAGREAVHSAQAAAAARVASLVLAGTGDDGSDGTRGASASGTGSGSSSAASLDGDGGGGGSGVGVDVLEAARGEGGAVCADGEGLEVGHCLVAGGGGVDAEDHALAAVDTVLLLAVEPWDLGQ